MIQRFEPRKPGYWIGFSGGKDSVVLMDLAERSGVKFKATYAATGIDPPEIVRFIREHYSGRVVTVRPKRSFFATIRVWGLPTIQHRWCCDELKKKPQIDRAYPVRLLGVRAEESSARAKQYNPDYYRRIGGGQWCIKPIFDWLEWEIWDYIESRKLPYCSLYDEGFPRLGCMICPYICGKNQAQLLRNRERWPGIFKAFEHAAAVVHKNKSHMWQYQMPFDDMLRDWYLGQWPGRPKK